MRVTEIITGIPIIGLGVRSKMCFASFNIKILVMLLHLKRFIFKPQLEGYQEDVSGYERKIGIGFFLY